MHALVRGLAESRSTASSSASVVFSAGGDPRLSSAFGVAGFLGDSGDSRSTLGCSYTTFFRPAGVESRCCCSCALVGVFGCDCLLSSILSSFLPLWAALLLVVASGGLFSAGDPRLLLLPAVVVAAAVLLLLLLSNTLEISPPVLPAVCVPGTTTPAADERCGADEATELRVRVLW